MSENNKEKVIDGLTFRVSPFPAVEALRLKAYLVRTLGPALAGAVDMFKGAGRSAADAEISGDSLCGVIEKLSASLDEEGRLFSIYPVMLLVLEANYPDFFGKMAGSIGSLTERTGISALADDAASSD